jgi:hypothetical protein
MINTEECDRGWGEGINTKENGMQFSYGYPINDNPNLFSQDHGECSEKEIQKWAAAKKKFDAGL